MSVNAESANRPTVLVEVEYFTDPLCCWSWALEPQWRRLRFEFGTQLAWRYRMGGMLPDWDSYNDPINSINRPAQMAPLWYQARELSGMPLADRIWMEDPPKSSYPACAAFKAAELQSPEAAEAYLRALREAVMLNGRNIARSETLRAIAEELPQHHCGNFDAQRFTEDLKGPQPLDALREDLRLARYLEIGRYPTLILRPAGEERGLVLTGYRPYSSLLSALRHVAESIQPVQHDDPRGEYRRCWGECLDRELRELHSPTC